MDEAPPELTEGKARTGVSDFFHSAMSRNHAHVHTILSVIWPMFLLLHIGSPGSCSARQ